MTQFTLTCFIKAPGDRVFTLFTDLENAPRYMSAVDALEVLTPGAVAVGTRLRQVRRVLGRSMSQEMEFVEFEAGRYFKVRAELSGTEYATLFRFAERDGGTRVILRFETRPLSPLGRLSAPLTRGLTGALEALFRHDLEDLRRVAEGGSNPANAD